MRKKDIPIQYLGRPEERAAWEKRCAEERRKNQAATRAYRAKQRLALQAELPLGLPKLILCPGCHGMGCEKCKKKGVIEDLTTPVVKKSEQPNIKLEGVSNFLFDKNPENEIPTTVVVNLDDCGRCWGVGRVARADYTCIQCPDCRGTGKAKSA